MKTIKVWDVPTRLFHWLLVLAIVGLWYTGTEADMDQHIPLAYFTLALLLFRIIWGFIGSFYSRFSAFPLRPSKAISYIRNGLHSDEPGHNPLGSWSVIVMLLTLAAQLITGLFANDSILTEGPLAHYVSNDFSDLMTSLHSLNFNILLGLIILHIAAILFYTVVKRDDILASMITGKRSVSANIVEPVGRNPAYGVAAITIAAGIVWLITRLGT